MPNLPSFLEGHPTTLPMDDPNPPLAVLSDPTLRLHLGGTRLVILCRPSELTVGRHRHCELRLPHPEVSRRHCLLRWQRAGWQILDLQSLNGVYLNYHRVARSWLRHGDRLQIGMFRFQVELSEPTPTTVSAHLVTPHRQAILSSIVRCLPEADQGHRNRAADHVVDAEAKVIDTRIDLLNQELW